MQFDRIEGCDYPMVANLLGTDRRSLAVIGVVVGEMASSPTGQCSSASGPFCTNFRSAVWSAPDGARRRLREVVRGC
ncbi:MAG: hypothetical protein KA763_14275 [Xanthomonadales bacterium]|nr:hypothetical protein [Xanthomonadales bacterium]